MSEATKTRQSLVLEELQDTGVNLVKLSEEAGLTYAALHTAIAKNTIFGDTNKMAKILKGKAKILKSYNPSRDSIGDICREAFIKQTFFAKRLGMSKQGLSQYLSLERQKQLKLEVQRVASTITTLADQLEKIKL